MTNGALEDEIYPLQCLIDALLERVLGRGVFGDGRVRILNVNSYDLDPYYYFANTDQAASWFFGVRNLTHDMFWAGLSSRGYKSTMAPIEKLLEDVFSSCYLP